MDLACRMLCADPCSKESFRWLWKALLSKLKTRNVTNKNYWIWVLKPCGTWLKYCQSNPDNQSSSIFSLYFREREKERLCVYITKVKISPGYCPISPPLLPIAHFAVGGYKGKRQIKVFYRRNNINSQYIPELLFFLIGNSLYQKYINQNFYYEPHFLSTWMWGSLLHLPAIGSQHLKEYPGNYKIVPY